jgi:uncharacterized protein with gpF-like domain
VRLPKGVKATRPVHANIGIQAAYRRKLDALVCEMARSYAWWIKAQYRETPPMLAQDATKPASDATNMAFDATPARELEREMSLLGKRWQARIDEAAPKLARWFADSTRRRSSAALKKILSDAGMTVEFQLTRTMRDAYEATVAENIGLIRSIGEEYHAQVGGMVMRSVTAGRDLGELTKALEARFDITRKRAALIARDQNNRATAVFTRVRQQELGLKAVWLHSHGGREPRPTHLANNGKTYDPAVGWYDPDPKVRKHIWPGTLINCRCVSRSIVKGFN